MGLKRALRPSAIVRAAVAVCISAWMAAGAAAGVRPHRLFTEHMIL